jgi:hypothetical protein
MTGTPYRDPVPMAWKRLDELLGKNRYMRFSLDTNRDWDDVTKRQWRAVIYMEGGKILGRATRDTRGEALIAVLEEMKQ